LDKELESGVYEGKALLNGKEYKAGVFISPDRKLLEAHLIGFSGDLYGEEIKIEIGGRARDIMKFENDEDLKKQIKGDIENICSQE